MEAIGEKKVRVFRGEEKILNLLNEYDKSNLSVKAFCQGHNLSSGSFHNWKKKYSNRLSKSTAGPGFTTLQIKSPARVAEPALFAEAKGIRIYQPVSAAYLRELLS